MACKAIALPTELIPQKIGEHHDPSSLESVSQDQIAEEEVTGLTELMGRLEAGP
jgi:hypothetical protein